MFQTLTTILTATTFVAHGLFGCCWHHGHTHLLSGNGAVHEHAACHGHHRHTHHAAQGQIAEPGHDAGRDSESPRPTPCDEGHCVFARTQDSPNSSVDASSVSAAFVLMALPCDVNLTFPVEPSALAALEPAAHFSAPLCALCQVWLI